MPLLLSFRVEGISHRQRPIQNCLSSVSIDPDYVCIGRKSNYSLNIALKGQPKANRNAGISANWRHWRVVLDDRLALNEGETAVIKSQAAFVWLCAVQPLEVMQEKMVKKHFALKLLRCSVIWDCSSWVQGEGQGAILTPSILWTVTNDLSRPISCSMPHWGRYIFLCLGDGLRKRCVLAGSNERGEIGSFTTYDDWS